MPSPKDGMVIGEAVQRVSDRKVGDFFHVRTTALRYLFGDLCPWRASDNSERTGFNV